LQIRKLRIVIWSLQLSENDFEFWKTEKRKSRKGGNQKSRKAGL
jgi:hypothetical protein